MSFVLQRRLSCVDPSHLHTTYQDIPHNCNLGPHQMARHLRGTLDADQIAHINRRHITTEKLDAALRDVINCFNRYTLPHYWGEEKRAAADGTQYELAEENLLAGKHIRYGYQNLFSRASA